MENKNCPFCGEEILAVAIKCKHCKSDIIKKNINNEVPIIDQVEKNINKIEKLRKCQKCNEMIPVIAIRCRNCGHETRKESELLPKNDFFGPLLGIILIVAFFLDWLVQKSGYKPSHYNGIDFFGSKIEHPVLIPILAIVFIGFMILIFLVNLKGENEFYLIRGIFAVFAGIIPTLYCTVILLLLDMSRYKSWEYGIGFYLTLICGGLLFYTGIKTSFVNFPLFKKEIKKIYGIVIKY